MKQAKKKEYERISYESTIWFDKKPNIYSHAKYSLSEFVHIYVTMGSTKNNTFTLGKDSHAEYNLGFCVYI